mmetsp:Transcript_18813/g.43550  ORF Transcript_18813/g.43550 Transcript_18813/m.43550 type:complete len:279 (-) Transcript_18813:164-1000(-)
MRAMCDAQSGRELGFVRSFVRSFVDHPSSVERDDLLLRFRVGARSDDDDLRRRRQVVLQEEVSDHRQAGGVPRGADPGTRQEAGETDHEQLHEGGQHASARAPDAGSRADASSSRQRSASAAALLVLEGLPGGDLPVVIALGLLQRVAQDVPLGGQVHAEGHQLVVLATHVRELGGYLLRGHLSQARARRRFHLRRGSASALRGGFSGAATRCRRGRVHDVTDVKLLVLQRSRGSAARDLVPHRCEGVVELRLASGLFRGEGAVDRAGLHQELVLRVV